MTLATTFPTVRRQLYDEVKGLGFNLTLSSSYGATNIKTSDPRVLYGGSSAVAQRYLRGFIARWNRVAGDQFRMLNALSIAANEATISHFGPDWSNTSDTDGEILAIDPNELVRLFGDALLQLKFRARIPLYHGPASADMQGSSVDSDWTESGASDTVQETAAEVFSNAQSLVLTDTGAGLGYAQSALNIIGQGKQLMVCALVKADTGTAKLLILDGSGNTQDSISTTQEDWVLMKKLVTFDTADEQWRLRLQAVAASDSGDWQAAWAVKQGINRIDFPSWFDADMTPVGVVRATFRESTSEADVYLAAAEQFEPLAEAEDFIWLKRFGDNHPYGVRILKPALLAEPLFLDFDCPYSKPYGSTTAGAFSAETDSTRCPPQLLIAQTKILIGQRYKERYGEVAAEGMAEKLTLLHEDLKVRPEKKTSGWGTAFS